MCQISVTFWIFNDPIHIHKGTSIGHFGSRALKGDEIIKIRKFLRKKGLLMSLRQVAEAAKVNEAVRSGNSPLSSSVSTRFLNPII